MKRKRCAALIAAATLALVAGGCSLPEHLAERRLIGALGPGFVDPARPPAPESTIRPTPGSWDKVRPPRGYRVVLLTAGDDDATTMLVTEVKEWARTEHVRLEVVAATDPHHHVKAIVEATLHAPDLIICAGNDLVDALALVTASYLKQQFLVVGAQLPEPTVNVTAAVWPGAAARGTEVPKTAESFHPPAFTPERAAAAIRAGVASVLSGLTGIVIALDSSEA